MFASTKKILEKADRGNYAVGQFNFYNLETLQAIVRAAEKMKAPVILATSEGAIGYAGMKYLVNLAKTAAEENKVPIALHLDHGQNIETIRQAIKSGYSSVMIDASREMFEKNIFLTEKVARLAHRKGISVEAELGTIGGAEDRARSRKIIYTDPETAREFVQRTGCDFLAVAIGTSHGAYKFSGKAKLDINRLKEIKKKVKIPLVLHGASGVPQKIVNEAKKYGAKLGKMKGVPDPQIKLAIKGGICKINTDTDLRLAFDAAVRKEIKTEPKEFDPRKILSPARDLIQKVVEGRLRLMGSGRER